MSKNTLLGLSFLAIIIASFGFNYQVQKEPWTEDQLLPPAELAKMIEDGELENVHIYSIGPAALIKNSVDIGEGRNPQNLEKLKKELSKLDKDAEIVIYCGCCPFANCPNVRPAFQLLSQMGFENPRLLNLSQNLKADWLDQNYPVKD